MIFQHVEAASVGPYLPFIHTILARGRVRLTSRHVDDTKFTDHHAIIPATQRVDPAALPPDEKRLYDLIARRFLAAFYPDAALERTTLSTEVEGERFTTRGTATVNCMVVDGQSGFEPCRSLIDTLQVPKGE